MARWGMKLGFRERLYLECVLFVAPIFFPHFMGLLGQSTSESIVFPIEPLAPTHSPVFIYIYFSWVCLSPGVGDGGVHVRRSGGVAGEQLGDRLGEEGVREVVFFSFGGAAQSVARTWSAVVEVVVVMLLPR